MKLQYCKPEAEVEDLLLEKDFLDGTQLTTTPSIDDDMDNPDDRITW